MLEKFLELLFRYDNMSEDEIRGFVRSGSVSWKNVRWLASHHPDNRIRRILFEETNVVVGEGTVININFIVNDNYKPLLKIGKRVAIAPNVTVICVSSPNNSRLIYNRYVRENVIVEKEVIIMDDVWIGTGAIIMPGVVVGEGAIIGAGALVTKEVDPYTIVAGVPAKAIRVLSTKDS